MSEDNSTDEIEDRWGTGRQKRKYELIDFFREPRKEVERLRPIADEVERLHYGTDLFTSCAAGEADRLIELIEKRGK